MKRRSAFSLLEVLLALAIAIMLLAALYSAINLQVRGMATGRNQIEQAAIVRSLFNRIGGDIAASINLVDPARFRNLAATQAAAEAAAAPAGGAAAPATPATPATPMVTDATAAAAAAAALADTSGGDATGTGSANANGVPLGVIGESDVLHLFASKVPAEAYKGLLVSDVRRITYWVGAGGLCRAEAKVVLTAGGTTPSIPDGDEEGYRLAAEVSAISFQYFDGAGWQDSWDSAAIGPDNCTPLGPPRAIAITLSVKQPAVRGVEPEPKTYRHVVVIPTANGQALNGGAAP